MSKNRKKLYLMDGTHFAYRAYYAFIKSPLRNSKGMNTSAPYGMMQSILKIIDQEKPDAFAIAFDKGKAKERLELYPEYKSTREKMPDEMRDSLPYIRQLVEAMRIPIIEKDGVEADDLMGTVAKRAVNKDWDVVLITGDKDFFQLIEEHISMLAPNRGALPTQWYTIDNATEKYGVKPEHITDFLALMGDSSDNVPGVSGIGKVTARNLIEQYGGMRNIYKHLDDIGGSKAKKLEQDREMAELSYKLVTLDTDVDFQFDWENAPLCEPDYEKLVPILEELEFTNLMDRFYKKTEGKTRKSEYILIDTEVKFEELLEKLRSAELISLDTETTSQRPMMASLVGISFSVEANTAYYIPVGHRRPGEMIIDESLNIDKKTVLEKLKPILESEKYPKVGQNLKYDYIVLFNEGIELKGIVGDSMIADYLLNPGVYEHGLDVLSMKHLGHRMMTYKEITSKENSGQLCISEVEPSRVALYSGEDSDIALQLIEKFHPELEEYDLKGLYQDLEIPLLPVLARMEIDGVGLDTDLLKNLYVDLNEKLEDIQQKTFDLAGEEFNLNSPIQLREILFDKLDLPVQKKTKTGPSTDHEVLTKLASMHELPGLIIDYRELAKLINTYIDSLPQLVNPNTKRIHPTFQQAVTSTGRLSCRDPNLQNIPVRGKTGREIRKAFIPKNGNVMISADYSQIELRVMAHISGDKSLIEAFREGKDIHSATASRIFNITPESVTTDQRRIAKMINFGVIYGMTPYGVSERLKIDFSEARKIVDAYFKRYPQVAEYMDKAPQAVEEKGYVETIMGRKRYFEELKGNKSVSKRFIQRAAINTPIQGSAADLIKIVMIRIDGKIHEMNLKSKMILTIHDELVFDTPENEITDLKSIVKEIMENAMQLDVPLVVDIGVGENWFSAHE